MRAERTRFEVIYRKEWRNVRDAALAIGVSAADAEDIAQHVFARLWCRGRPAWDRPLSSGFFRRAGRNEALKLVKRQQRADTFSDELLHHLPHSLATLDELLEQSELLGLLRASVSRLPLRWRSIIERKLIGWTRAEIADQLYTSEKAVEKSIARAYRRLREDPTIVNLLRYHEAKHSSHTPRGGGCTLKGC